MVEYSCRRWDQILAVQAVVEHRAGSPNLRKPAIKKTVSVPERDQDGGAGIPKFAHHVSLPARSARSARCGRAASRAHPPKEL